MQTKHQAQPAHRSTAGFSRPSQSGATKHQLSTASDSRKMQSMKKSVHQGQTHEGSPGKHQGQSHNSRKY